MDMRSAVLESWFQPPRPGAAQTSQSATQGNEKAKASLAVPNGIKSRAKKPIAPVPSAPARLVTNLDSNQAHLERLTSTKKEESSIVSAPRTRTKRPNPTSRSVSSSPIPQKSRSRKKNRFPEHLALELTLEGIRNGRFVEGVIRVNQHRARHSYVTVQGHDRDILIDGARNRNRAFDGDVVAVEILDKAQWVPVPEEDDVLESDSSSDDESEKDISKDASKQNIQKELRPTGRIVAIIQANHSLQVVGYLKSCGSPGLPLSMADPLAFFIPLDKRVPRLLVPIRRRSPLLRPSCLESNLFSARLSSWPITSLYPKGELVQNLGAAGNLDVEMAALLAEADISWDENFAAPVVESLSFSHDWKIPEEELKTRMDFRKLRVFSIDPPTARDLDDAISCTALGDGSYEVGVHIADVSYFVTPECEADKEAWTRATSVYLVNRCIPMLPRILCENLCSLVPGKERLAFSVLWRMTPEGEILGPSSFHRSVINSCVRLDYAGAQALLDDGTPTPSGDVNTVDPSTSVTIKDIAQDLKILQGITRALKHRRYHDGSLALNQPKICFSLDSDGFPTGTFLYQLKESNSLIEELMLLANRSVAQKIIATFPDGSLLRCHPEPNPRLLKEFAGVCAKAGTPVDVSSAASIHRSLEELKNKDADDYVAVTHLATRPMSTAKYTCTRTGLEHSSYHHFALSFDLYTHFTSPIRRYADLIVHRILAASLQEGPSHTPIAPETIQQTCRQCNERKSKADKAEQRCDNIFLCMLLLRFPPTEGEKGFVTEVTERGLKILVPKYAIERKIYLEDLAPILVKSEWDKGKQSHTLCWRDRPLHISEHLEPEPASSPLLQAITLFDRVWVHLAVDPKQKPMDVAIHLIPNIPGGRTLLLEHLKNSPLRVAPRASQPEGKAEGPRQATPEQGSSKTKQTKEKKRRRPRPKAAASQPAPPKRPTEASPAHIKTKRTERRRPQEQGIGEVAVQPNERK